MKIRTRLTLAFITITVLPFLLITVFSVGIMKYQVKEIQETYEISTQIDLWNNPTQTFNRMTQPIQNELSQVIEKSPTLLEDSVYLDSVNEKLLEKCSYLIVRKEDDIVYCGSVNAEQVFPELPTFNRLKSNLSGGIYIDGEQQHLLKQIDFQFSDKSEGTIFIITEIDASVPEVEKAFREVLFLGVMILCFSAMLLITWVYHSLLSPLQKLQEATKQIRDGNLDFSLEIDNQDEIGRLCQDFEEMRLRLKESQEAKMQYDKESKELISNISHDLKTPITSIKGYVDGILDGVASAPEKLEKYIRTISTKANDMDRLIDELTFYSKIDTNKIPYNFTRINVAAYFRDCIEEVGVEMETRGIEFGYFNYVDESVTVIADPEQMKRVINNIIGNSVKYLDKPKGIINIRIEDDGDFIQIIIEDNGKGIDAKDLPMIFERFYRTDSSRNSAKGGSGIGLSIVKKIIEDHGGRIWATSKLNVGTSIHFVLRKHQEVETNE